MRHVVLCLCLLSLTLLPAAGRANSPPVPQAFRYLQLPDKAAKDDKKSPLVEEISITPNAPVSLTYQLDLARPKLIIPQKYLLTDGKAQKAEAEPGGSRNLFAGVALSAAFVSGGIWLVRRGGGNSRKALLVIAIGSSLVGAAFLLPQVFGNAGRPPRVKELTPIEFNNNSVDLGMDVVIVGKGERIQLLLPKRILPAVMIPRDVYENGVDPYQELIRKSLEPAKDGDKKKE